MEKEWVEYFFRYPQLCVGVARMIRARKVSRPRTTGEGYAATPEMREDFAHLMEQVTGREEHRHEH